jgi:hypothetical protein
MDDRRFDGLTRALATGRNRREVMKGLLGIGAGAVAGGALFGQGTEAARRGFSGPVFPTFTPCQRDINGVCCASGVFEPGGICCTNGMIDSLGYCCDPNSGGGWTGCCCTASPGPGGVQECVC